MNLYAGTSGFSYPKWKGKFYPKDAKTDSLLQHYAARLPSVEINNTFYRMPRENVVQGWKSQVPLDFRFSMKASRRITHYAKLKDCAESVQFLLQALQPLEATLGVVLFQMPPQFQKNLEVLEAFLETLPRSPRVAMEFRHRSWFDDAVYARLSDAKVALVGGDGDDALPDLVPTTDFGYLRLRGDAYDDTALAQWQSRLASTDWKHAFVYFKHEELGPHFAEQLIQLCVEKPGARAAPAQDEASGLAAVGPPLATPTKATPKATAADATRTNKPARPGLKKTVPKPAKTKRQAK